MAVEAHVSEVAPLGIQPDPPAARHVALRFMHGSSISIWMRTTLNLDEQVIEEARTLTGIREKTELVHRGLKALIAQTARERLAKLAGTQPQLRVEKRRRNDR